MSRWADSTDEEDYLEKNDSNDDHDFDGPTKSFEDNEVSSFIVGVV
jgi:hypothetical protein